MSETEEELDYWRCPKCGWDSSNGDNDPAGGQVRYGPFRSAYWAQLEFGGDPGEWEEFWTCQDCGNEFSFTEDNI